MGLHVTPPPPPAHPFLSFLCLTKTRQVEPNISNLDISDQSSDFHRPNVHSLCFLAQALPFFLLFFLSSGFFAAIVDIETCLLLSVLCEAFMWALISGAVDLQFLRLLTLMNFSAAEVTLGLPFPGAVLMRASFVMRWMVFTTALEDRFNFFDIFWTGWPSCLKVMTAGRFSLLSLYWSALAIIWIRTVVEWGCSLYWSVYNTTDGLRHIKKAEADWEDPAGYISQQSRMYWTETLCNPFLLFFFRFGRMIT